MTKFSAAANGFVQLTSPSAASGVITETLSKSIIDFARETIKPVLGL